MDMQPDLVYPVETFAVPSVNWEEDMAKYNLIVVPILSEQEQEDSQAALWQEMGPTVTEDPLTWDSQNWPDPSSCFLTSTYAISQQAFKNRLHPKILEVFQVLYGKEVMGTIDFWGVKRPPGRFVDGAWKQEPDWKLNPLRLHWDTDIVQYVEDQKKGRKRYQALVALNENSYSVGSFACVPGSANELAKWVKEFRGPEQKKYVPFPNPLHKRVQKIPLQVLFFFYLLKTNFRKAGHMVVWEVGVAHTNFTNSGAFEPRLTQYVRMIPAMPWAVEREKQALLTFWKENPQIKIAVAAYPWTDYERQVLALVKLPNF